MKTKIFTLFVTLSVTAAGAEISAPATWRPPGRWRGFNLEGKAIKGRFSGEWREADLRMMHELGFNFVRVMIDHRYWCLDNDWTKPDPMKFGPIDEVIGWGKKHKIHVQLCFSFPPGIDVETKSKAALFTDGVARQAMADHWRYFARRYKGIPNEELSFNLFNEPDCRGTEATYAPLIAVCEKAIHDEDAMRFIVIDGLRTATLPLLAAIKMPVGQSHHAYEPSGITHFRASWVSKTDWQQPAWPPQPVVSPIYGMRKPLEAREPIAIRDVPDCALTITPGLVNREAELVVAADGVELFRRLMVPSPGVAGWTNLIARTEKEWAGKLTVPIKVIVPASERLTIGMARGDWMEIMSFAFTADHKTVSVKPSSCWSLSQRRPELRFAGFDATQAVTLADGTAYTAAHFLKYVTYDNWQPVFEAGQFVMVGEFGVFNLTPHDVALRWMEDNLREWKARNMGWAMWNFRGPFGILDSNRADVQYEDFQGHKLDRKMLELLKRY
jgi:hypothetical protein